MRVCVCARAQIERERRADKTGPGRFVEVVFFVCGVSVLGEDSVACLLVFFSLCCVVLVGGGGFLPFRASFQVCACVDVCFADCFLFCFVFLRFD